MVRGDVYWVELTPRSGAEQTGRRPCIVVSSDAFNLAVGWRSVTVVPLTTSERWLRVSPTTIVLQKGESNLPERCAAMVHQVTTIDRAKLIGAPIGRVSETRMEELEAALMHYLLF